MPNDIHQSVSLSDRTVALILGSLLGDGSLKIHPGYKNARFSFRHSIKQINYFDWKVDQLTEISGDKHRFLQKPDGFSKHEKLRYQSLALPSLTELYELTHERKQFRIRRKWLNNMSDLSLAIWWLDDGSLISNTRKGVISTDGFDHQSVKRLARYLQVVWHINTTVGVISNRGKNFSRESQYYRIWIRSGEELKKLLRIVAPHVHQEDMLYKVLILYKDPELQQRWISEIAALTEFSTEQITAVVNQRKASLKLFSENDIVHPLM
jgi:hypothetical protein